MNKIALGLVCLDIAANFLFYLTYEDYEPLVVCFFKCTGIYGVITGDLCPIIGYVFLSCIIAIIRVINFIHGFSILIFFSNIFSFITCFVVLKNTCSNEVIQTELGFKLGITS